LVQPFGLLHHHVHGHVPLTIVGTPVAQVAVGVVYELKVTLHAQLVTVGDISQFAPVYPQVQA
jgi:hypothetical protein